MMQTRILNPHIIRVATACANTILVSAEYENDPSRRARSPCAALHRRASSYAIKEADGVTVEVKVKNTGPVAGQEVVQLYVREQRPEVVRPEKELKAFTKAALQTWRRKNS
jgi:hypothetical protein